MGYFFQCGVPVGVTRRKGGFPPAVAARGGGFGGKRENGVGFSGAGCGQGFLWVACVGWGISSNNKTGWREEGEGALLFRHGVWVGVPRNRVGGVPTGKKWKFFLWGWGVPVGSWKDGVSSVGLGSDEQKGEAFLARGSCRWEMTTMGGKN